MIDENQAFEHESKGAQSGLNPMFGDWSHVFLFAPVPYGAGGERRAEFSELVRDAIANQFLFTHDVRLKITLFLDLQKVLETDQTADLDNYAKVLLDALKGPCGIVLDDTQFQALTISWIDNNGREDTRFEVHAQSSPDDFMLKPVELYELSDGLYYPYSRRAWSLQGKETGLRDQYIILKILDETVGFAKSFRHTLRRKGYAQLAAFRNSQYVAPIARGFHRSRIDEFTVHRRQKWLQEVEAWIHDNPDEGKIIRDIIEKLGVDHDQFLKGK